MRKLCPALPDCGQLPSRLPGPAVVNHRALPGLRALGACSLTKDWRFHLALLEPRVGLPVGWFSPQTLSGLGRLLLSFQGELLRCSVCVRNVSEQSSAGAVLLVLTFLIPTSPRAFVQLFVPVCVL